MASRKKATAPAEAEVKTTAAVETAEVAETPAKKTAGRKAAAKKTAASKKAVEAVEAVAVKEEVKAVEAEAPKAEVFIEYGGVQVPVDEIIKNARITVGEDKDVKIYVKPDESKAYIAFGDESVAMDVFFCE